MSGGKLERPRHIDAYQCWMLVMNAFSLQQKKRFVPAIFEKEIHLSSPEESRSTSPVESQPKRRLLMSHTMCGSSTQRDVVDTTSNRRCNQRYDYDCYQRKDHPPRYTSTVTNHQIELLRSARSIEHEAVIKEIFSDVCENSSTLNDENHGLKLDDMSDNNDILPPCFNSLLYSQPHSLNSNSIGSNSLTPLEESATIGELSTTHQINPIIKAETKPPKHSKCTTICEQDFQFITETNKQLVSLLPRKTNTLTEHIFKTDSEFQNTFFDSFEQTPLITREDDVSSSNNNNTNDIEDMFVETNFALKFEDESSNNSYNEQDIRNTETSFYDIIEEHVRKKNDKHSGIQLDKEIVEKYNAHEQEIIKKLIHTDNSTALPSADLELQEVIKRERKKMKNRVAASKCRRKKLEREAQLELKVAHLKERSLQLNSLAHTLRKEATNLKDCIIQHMNAGCSLEFGSHSVPRNHTPYFM